VTRAEARASVSSRFPDYVASCILSCAALQAFGSSLEAEPLGMKFSVFVIFGCAFSFFVRYAGAGRRWLEWGPWLCAIAAAIGWSFPLVAEETLSGGDAFGQFSVGARVASLLALRSICLWSDGDVVFQAVPAMALFGLGATYSTEAGLVLFFVVFLVCVAYMLARQHARTLMDFALQAGVPMARARRSVAQAAGPRHAILVVAIVLALSFMAAPLLQTGVSRLLTPVLLARSVPNIGRLPAPDEDPDAKLEIGVGVHSSTNTVVLRVQADRPLYLRERAYAVYDGVSWSAARAQTYRSYRRRDGSGVAFSLAYGQPAEVMDGERDMIDCQVAVQSGLHAWLYAPADPITLIGRSGTLTSRVFVDYLPDIGVQVPRLNPGTFYTVWSRVPNETPARLRRSHARAAPVVYRQLPPVSDPELGQLARRVTEGYRTDYDKIEALRHHISRTCQYSLSEPAFRTGDRVSEFLFDRKKGYCDAFASALAVMARHLGYPARVVSGFAPGDYDADTGTWIAREKHFHLWTEVHFEDVGWVVFDATEGAEEVDALAVTDEQDTVASRFWRSRWPALLINSAILLVLAYLAFSWLRSRKTAGSRVAERQEVAALYGRFLASLRWTGCRRLPHQTPLEHLALVAPGLPGVLRHQARAIVDEVTAALFRREIGGETVARLRAAVEQWRRRIRASRKEKR
jgi:hypothetical protein